ncbi:MAG: TonB-dependent receptor [Pseudomonadota bacterium]
MDKHLKCVKALAIGIVVSLPVLPAPLFAQLLLEEITVTAQKREQNLSDVGISVTAFSGTQIEQLGLTNSIDIAAQTPGLIIQQQHPNITTVNLRGVSQNDFSSHLEPPVAMYVDDAYVASMGAAHTQMYDLERVEVLRGPQGTLFGRNATGGLLHYISRKPTDEFEGFGRATLGDYGLVKFEAAVSGGLSDTVLGRLSIATNKHDGVLENRIGEDLRAADGYAVRGQVQFVPNEDLSVLVKGSYTEDDTVGNAFSHQPGQYDATGLGNNVARDQVGVYGGLFDPFALIFGPCPGCDPRGFVEPNNDPHDGAFDFTGFFQREITNVQVKVNWNIGDLTLTSISDYFDMDKGYTEDTDSSPIAGISFLEGEERDQFSQELRLAGSAERLEWLGGVYYLDFESDTSGSVTLDAGPQATFVPGGATPFPAWSDPSNPCLTTGPCPTGIPDFLATFGHMEKVETTSMAIFGHVEYQLTDAVSLIGALRYTEDERDMSIVVDNAQLGGPVLMLNPGNTPQMAQEFENFSAKAQMDWRPNDNWLVYASYTRGHKAGNFSAPLFVPATVEELVHDEEELHSFEVGAKGSFIDDTLRINASAFYYTYNDYQASFFVEFTQQIANLDAKVYGSELELVYVPTDSLSLQLGVSLLDTEVENVGMPDGSIQDRQMPNSPDLSVNGLLRYTWPVFSGDLSAQVDFNYVDNFCFTVVCHPTEEEDSYLVSNLRLSFASGDDKWEVAAFVNNLADEEYRVFGGDASFVGSVSSSPALPRWFGASVAFHWD